MKYESYAEYNPRAVAQTHPAFLTVWSGLGAYHEDLVLLGGLVPHYICKHPERESLPRPATLDVDFGVALGATAGQYGTLATDLRAQGFRPSAEFTGRFEKMVDNLPLYIDFLVEDGTHAQGTRMVDDVLANVMPGVVRALKTARTVPIEGEDLFGAKQRLSARVCDAGPFLALKLRAFLRRQQGKDAFDTLYTLLHYCDGTDAAIKAFADEEQASNTAFPDAKWALESLLAEENGPGPVKAAHFVFGPIRTGESASMAERRQRVRQDMFAAAQQLLRALSR